MACRDADFETIGIRRSVVRRLTFGARPSRGGRLEKVAQRAVPKLDPGLDAVARGAQGPFVPLRRVRDQTFEQLPPHWTVAVAIELDVPFDVVDEMTQGIVVVVVPRARQRLLQPAEHLRDDVLAAVKEF